jgi:hypothetical protein
MKSKTIIVDEKEIEIKAIPFRKVLEILKYIKTLPTKIKESIADIDLQDGGGVDKLLSIGVFADVIHESGDELIDILATASGLTAKEIGSYGMADMLRLFNALLEVNDIDEIKKELGELRGIFKE